MSAFNDVNAHGDPISRQISFSLVTPHTLTGYQDFFRQNSNMERGYVMLKYEEMSQWERKWCIFEDNEVRFADSPSSPESEFQKVFMDKVVNLTADQSPKDPTIKITTTETRLQLKLSDLDQMRSWLFCFQKSSALVLTHILEAKSKAANFLQAQLEDRKIWTTELGHGHGCYQNVARRHQTGNASSNRAYTMEDLGYRDNSSLPLDRDVPFPPKWADRVDPPSPVKMLAVSPAIPIHGMERASYDDDYDRRERVASSFKDDTDKFSPLEEMLQRSSRRVGEREGSDNEDGNDSGSEGDAEGEAGYMMFEMDDAGEPKPGKEGVIRARSQSSEDSGGRQRRHSLRSAASPSLASSIGTASLHSSSFKHSLQMTSDSLARRDGCKHLRWRTGYCSKLGPRSVNEDRFVVMPVLPGCGADEPSEEMQAMSQSSRHAVPHATDCGGGQDSSAGFFAVYDGHCGDQAATFLQEVLMERISSHELFWRDIEAAIVQTCIQVDQDFLEICRRRRQYCGTTAVGSFILGNVLTVFNIGDSMAVLCSAGTAIEMSDSHKPGREDEAERIRQAQGWITEEKELYMARLHRMDLADPLVMNKAQNMNWVTIHRVCGELAVSRSIGDPDYKTFVPGAPVEAFFSWPEGHTQIFMADLVIPDPECKTREIRAEDEFLILASDGLWDVISSQEVVQYVQRAFAAQKLPSEVAEELCDLSIRLGSSDNVTVVLVQFIHQ